MVDEVGKMNNNKIVNIITWILYLLYTGSIILFVKEKNMFNILICIVCIILTLGLQIIKKKTNRFIDDQLYIVMVVFIMIASLLGSCYGFYSINHFDDFLHVWSGFIACSFAYLVLRLFNSDEQIGGMNKFFILIYLLMFSVAVAGFWEIGEFTMDSLLGTKTQVGGLKDTMIDMIDGLIGAVIMIPFIMKKFKKKN